MESGDGGSEDNCVDPKEPLAQQLPMDDGEQQESLPVPAAPSNTDLVGDGDGDSVVDQKDKDTSVDAEEAQADSDGSNSAATPSEGAQSAETPREVASEHDLVMESESGEMVRQPGDEFGFPPGAPAPVGEGLSLVGSEEGQPGEDPSVVMDAEGSGPRQEGSGQECVEAGLPLDGLGIVGDDDSDGGSKSNEDDGNYKITSPMKDADGTVGEKTPCESNRILPKESSPEQMNIVAASLITEEISKADLDDFFEMGQVDHKAANLQGQYPALDNVDFETDEEGAQEPVAVAEASSSSSKGDQQGDTSSKGDHLEVDLSAEGAGTKTKESLSKEGSASKVLVEALAYMSHPEEKGCLKIAIVDSQGGSTHKDYPHNFQNYKVCRELQPGVMECLILETGERFLCWSNPSQSNSSDSAGDAAPSPMPVYLLQQERSETSALPPHSSSGLSEDEQATLALLRSSDPGSEGYRPPRPPLHGQNVRVTTGELDLNVAYIPLKDAEAKKTSAESLQPKMPRVLLEGDEHAFITENGVPVILDNAEDDLKLEMMEGVGLTRRVGGAQLSSQSQSGDHGNQMWLDLAEVVEDVLSSEGDVDSDARAVGPGKEKSSSKKFKRKKEKKEELFYELRQEMAQDSTEESQSESGSYIINVKNNSHNNNNSNNNNNNNNEEADSSGGVGQQEEGNLNNSANERLAEGSDLHARDGSLPDRLTTDRPRGQYVRDHSIHSHASHKGEGSPRTYSRSGAGQSSMDSRSYEVGTDNSYPRMGSTASADSSCLSTRYSRVEKGNLRAAPSKSESVTVPKFKTLQDQQVSWLEMFKLIEQQHRCELQSQYREHQRILQDMQHNMDQELDKQQDTLKQRLSKHREFLEELSPGRLRSRQALDVNQSRGVAEEVSDSADSQTSLQGVSLQLRTPAPLSRYHQDVTDRKFKDHVQVKRSLEKELSSSPSRPADTSLNLSRVSVGRDKQLRGGVYSSPMPLAKYKHKNSPRASKSHEEASSKSYRDQSSRNSNSVVGWDYNSSSKGDEPHDRSTHHSANVSLTESEDVLSPRTRISLREKHAKHLADLRAYYEEQLGEMRQVLSNRTESTGGPGELSPGEKILSEENHELRRRCQQLEDNYHDAKIEVRELQQKIQGLEIRACDYEERFDTAQDQVMSLRTRLEELTEFAKVKESTASELETKNKKHVDNLQMAYKKEKELTDSLHSAKTTIERLVDKYETLEKDHHILKEQVKATEERLYNSRGEAMEVNNKYSRLEVENKQLQHDLEVMKHELTMARSAPSARASYSEAYRPRDGSNSRTPRKETHTSGPRPIDKSFRSPSGDRHHQGQPDVYPDSETDSECSQSPIMKAERELKKLQKSMASQDFMPKLQKKFYGTEVPATSFRGMDSTPSPNRTKSGSTPFYAPREKSLPGKKGNTTPQKRESASCRVTTPSSSVKSPGKVDVGSRPSKDPSRVSGGRVSKDNSVRKSTNENGFTGDQAMEKIRSGDIVSRPAWEDVYTSMARPQGVGAEKFSPASNMTRDQMIRERLQNIECMERSYDDLTNEKRKYEAALNKLPVLGHRGEKERLESELDRVDRDLGSIRLSLKRFQVLKTTM